jgi:uncharacterized protein YjbJ (UPF0337 family)
MRQELLKVRRAKGRPVKERHGARALGVGLLSKELVQQSVSKGSGRCVRADHGTRFIVSELSGRLTRRKRGKQMNPSTKDQIKGDLHQVKGGVKEKVGQVTNDANLAADGQGEKLAGKVQKKMGQVEKVFEK